MFAKSFGFLVLTWMFFGGCSDNSNRVECNNQAQCNPDKTCGNMIQCVDGQCDPETTVNLPCDQDCSLDNNCPVGMHCRLTDGVGECVVDGTCVDPAECAGLEHDDCVGSFSCQAGLCEYNCQMPNSCTQDEQCVLADKNCCCGPNQDDFIALPQDQLDEWIAREECKGIICPKIACIVPTTIEAACLEGKCQIRQTSDWQSCTTDQDCIVVESSCCPCLDGTGQTESIHKDKLDAWLAKQECNDVVCEQCPFTQEPASQVCFEHECHVAHCAIQGESGHCYVESVSPSQCTSDKQCTENAACPSCGCESGYAQTAINTDFQDSYLSFLDASCAIAGACQSGPYGVDVCLQRPTICSNGHCQMMGQQCECDTLWDPICAKSAQTAATTFPNECQARCAMGEHLQIVYPGRCECAVDCDCDDLYDCAACASNGKTYHCTYGEIECNDLVPLYPGTCNPDCDYCNQIDSVPVKVCGAEFITYARKCFAECLARQWWHEGECLSGEGNLCKIGVSGACKSDELFCLAQQGNVDPIGRCIKLGHCLSAKDCQDQPLTKPDCIGDWTCPDHKCIWKCR